MDRILTDREKLIFELLLDNYTTSDIARYLGISKRTVSNHISNVIQKLNVVNRSQAIVELLKLNILKLENPL